MREAAAVFFVNANGELLLRLRDDIATIPFPGHWDLIGGLIEAGETPEQALRREAREELGVELDGLAFYGRVQGIAVLVHAYVARLETAAEDLTLQEGQRVAWFRPEQALSLPLVPWVRRTLPALIASHAYLEVPTHE